MNYDKLTIEELKVERERLVSKYIGELHKGSWYFKTLEKIDILIKNLNK